MTACSYCGLEFTPWQYRRNVSMPWHVQYTAFSASHPSPACIPWERSTLNQVDSAAPTPHSCRSHVLQNIVPSIGWVTGVSTLVVGYMWAYDHGVLPDGFPSLAPSTACSAFVTQTSVALSLLLVFRTNAGYGRWDEARKMWGGLLNRSRDIMRQVRTYCYPAARLAAGPVLTCVFKHDMRRHA